MPCRTQRNQLPESTEMELREIAPNFALEVIGLKIWKDIDENTVRQLDDALSRNGVLVFRRQSISEAELVDFSRHFGAAETIVRSDWASKTSAEVTRISNLRSADGQPIGGLGSGELAWHADQSYMQTPATGAFLYGVEVPVDGPETMWANLALAYNALPTATKDLLDGKKGVFSYAKRVSGYDQEATPEDVRKSTPDVLHSLVNVHPVTGEKALYLDPGTTIGVDGMSASDGQSLLDDLAAHATSSAFVYRHNWQSGDVIIWDNGFLLHRRDAFTPNTNRLLKRTTIRLDEERHIVPK